MPSLRRGLLSLACFLALIAAPSAWAAPSAPWQAFAHTSFRHQTDSAMGVGTALAQDQTGFIWLGTQTGLVRWDGIRQRRFPGHAGQAGALPDSYIRSLHVDTRARLWVGTNSAGLARYDAASDSFLTIPTGPGGLSHGRISAIADDGHGGIWVGSGGGLEHIRADGAIFAATSGAPRLAAGALAKGGIDALLRDRDGGLWIGTRAGLFHRASDTQAPRPVALAQAGAPPIAVSTLYQDSAGRIWVGTRANGAFVLERGDAPARPVLEPGQGAAHSQERVLSLVEKREAVMWIGTEGGGIIELDTRDGSTRRLRHQAGVQDSLLDNDVVAMLRARSGQIVVATIDALSQHDPRPQGVTTVRSTGATGSGARLSVMSLLARPDGQVWLGTAGGAIDIVDPAAGRVTRIGADGRAGALPKGRILAIANGPENTVFIGTQQGLYRSDANGGQLRRIEIAGRPAESSVEALAWHQGVLWLGGLDGLWALSLDGSPTVLRHEDASLGDSRVSSILAGADGIWIGTTAGVARIDAAGGKLERLPTNAGDPTRLPPGHVSSMLKDAKGRLWISHFATGVSVLERTDQHGRHWFKRLDVRNGLPDNGVNVLVTDRRGQIWISTDRGLASIDPASYRVRTLNAADGVHVPTYWSGAGARADSGGILFGGSSGLTVIDPEQLTRPTSRAAIAVTQVVVGGRELPVAPFNSAGARATLTVTPDQRERGFSLDFAALDFRAPELRRFAYRLDGFDADWIDIDGGVPRAAYTNLPPGRYTLKLRAGASHGAAPAVLTLAVQVLPAWHQQLWVRALALLGVLALGASLMQARLSLLRRRQRELEATVDARTFELRATQAELETMAYSDALTGLPNRRRFNEEMARLVEQAASGGERFNLLLIDLDHFKTINDTLGHDAGDAVLMTVADRLKLAMRDHDCVARLGGDEFAVLMSPSLDHAVVERICQRIVASLSKPIAFGEHTMQVSASVGATTFQPGQDALARTYKSADIALYESKKAGRNGYRISADGAEAALPEALQEPAPAPAALPNR